MCRVLRSRFPSSRLLCFYFCYSLPTFPRELFDNLLSWLLSPLGYMCRWTERAPPVRIERMLSRNPSCLFFFFTGAALNSGLFSALVGAKNQPLVLFYDGFFSFLPSCESFELHCKKARSRAVKLELYSLCTDVQVRLIIWKKDVSKFRTKICLKISFRSCRTKPN